MNTPPFFIPRQLMCFQGCKASHHIETKQNRRMELLSKHIIQQLPKAKLRWFSLALKPLWMTPTTTPSLHSFRLAELWIQEIIAHWRIKSMTLSSQSCNLDFSLLWIQVGMCGHLRTASPPAPAWILPPFRLWKAAVVEPQCWWPHHSPASPHLTPSPTFTECLL